MNPAESARPKRPAPTATAATSRIVTTARRTSRWATLTYPLVARSNTQLNPRKKAPSGPRPGPWVGLRNIAHSAGESESALKAESSTEMAMVRANCWYIRPVRPPRKATGTKTAHRMRAIPTTGAVTSFMAWLVASRGPRPCSM